MFLVHLVDPHVTHKTWFYHNFFSSFLSRILKIKFWGSNILEPPNVPDCQSCTGQSLSNLLHFFFQSMALFSWCSWMFAINVIIYVVSSSYFRQIYQIFMADIIHGVRILWRNCCNSNKNNTTPPQMGESAVIELTHV